MTATTIPSVVPMFTLASQDLGLGGWEWIIILVVILILFGRRQFADIARGLIESIDNFKAGIRSELRQQDSDPRPWVFIVLALMAAVIILSVLRLDGLSGEQKLVLSVTLLGWIAVGYWSFGRNLRKRGGR